MGRVILISRRMRPSLLLIRREGWLMGAFSLGLGGMDLVSRLGLRVKAWRREEWTERTAGCGEWLGAGCMLSDMLGCVDFLPNAAPRDLDRSPPLMRL